MEAQHAISCRCLPHTYGVVLTRPIANPGTVKPPDGVLRRHFSVGGRTENPSRLVSFLSNLSLASD